MCLDPHLFLYHRYPSPRMHPSALRTARSKAQDVSRPPLNVRQIFCLGIEDLPEARKPSKTSTTFMLDVLMSDFVEFGAAVEPHDNKLQGMCMSTLARARVLEEIFCECIVQKTTWNVSLKSVGCALLPYTLRH